MIGIVALPQATISNCGIEIETTTGLDLRPEDTT